MIFKSIALLCWPYMTLPTLYRDEVKVGVSPSLRMRPEGISHTSLVLLEKLYEEISEILHLEERGQVNAMVMGDFNSIVGKGSTDKVVGPFGLCRRNERGKMLIDFCK